MWNYNRGFYLSFDLSYDELALINLQDKRGYKRRLLKDQKKAALMKAKKQLS